MISAWSMSRLFVFEECPFRAKLQYVDKVPEPDRGDPPARFNGEWPHLRGQRIHDEMEQIVIGKTDDVPRELRAFEEDIWALCDFYDSANHKVETEQMWCFNKDWEPVDQFDFNNIWLRVKTDATVFFNDHWALVVDLKTGKKFGNEVKHNRQMQLYVLGAFMKYPGLERVTVELWYSDLNDISRFEFTRHQAMKLFDTFHKAGLSITECTEFEPNPNTHSCKYCPYKEGKLFGGAAGTGHCKVGV